MANSISIKGLTKAAVLAALYNNSKIQGLGFLQATGTEMSILEAEAELEDGFSFDYLHGKVMKIDISDEEFNPWGYDRDNGAGKAEQVITRLRELNLTSAMN